MAIPIEEWTKTHVDKFIKKGESKGFNKLYEYDFFRNEKTPIYVDKNSIYSPAFGTILYSKFVEGEQELCEVKGKNFTVYDLIGQNTVDKNKFYKKFYVIGIFMSFADQHTNHVPYDGLYYHKDLPTISTKNRPMLKMEESLFNKNMVNFDDSSYLFTNQRKISKFVSTNLNGYEIYTVQIADSEVDAIINHFPNSKYLTQCSIFGQIRMGSQCDLILPIYEGMPFDLESLVPVNYHVEGGKDKLLKIDIKNRSEWKQKPFILKI